MQPIDDTMLSTLEQLACLHLSDTERQPMTTQLYRILDCFAQLNTIIPDDIPQENCPCSCPLREDIAVPFADTKAILSCAPQQNEPYIVVPKAVE